MLVKSGSGAAGLPDSPGVPEDTTKNTILVPFNDEEAIINLIKTHGDFIGAIIVEPIMGNIGIIPPKDRLFEIFKKNYN